MIDPDEEQDYTTIDMIEDAFQDVWNVEVEVKELECELED